MSIGELALTQISLLLVVTAFKLLTRLFIKSPDIELRLAPFEFNPQICLRLSFIVVKLLAFTSLNVDDNACALTGRCIGLLGTSNPMSVPFMLDSCGCCIGV